MNHEPLTWIDAHGNTCQLRVKIEYANGKTPTVDDAYAPDVVSAMLSVSPELRSVVRESISEEKEAEPLLRKLVQQLCDAVPDDIESATVQQLIDMCELECTAEHERAVAAEEKLLASEHALARALEEANTLTNQVAPLRKLLGASLKDATEEQESWQDEARELLGWRPEFNVRKAYKKSLETIQYANATAEERLQEIWKLEKQIEERKATEVDLSTKLRDAETELQELASACVLQSAWQMPQNLAAMASRRAIFPAERTAASVEFEPDLPPGPLQEALRLFDQALEHDFGTREHARGLGLALKEALFYLNSLPDRVQRALERQGQESGYRFILKTLHEELLREKKPGGSHAD